MTIWAFIDGFPFRIRTVAAAPTPDSRLGDLDPHPAGT